MAIPLQYQSQFIPTDFGAVSNVLGMYKQDMNQREQQFDLAQQMQDKAIANIYGIETLDPELFQQAGDALSQRIEELVSKRGGDYGAAAQDISRLIAQESRNPIYGLNKRKLEQTKLLEQALAKNPNLLPLQDPRKISLTQKGLTPEDISYSVADPATIQDAIKDIYGERGNQIRQTGLKPSGTKGYLMSEITRGLTDAEIQQLAQDPATLETLLARVPQLQGYMDNPEVADWFTSQVQEGLKGLKGGSQKQFVRDYTYESTNAPGGINWGAFPLPIFNDLVPTEKKENLHMEASPRLRSKTSEQIGFEKPSSEGYIGTQKLDETYADDIEKYTANFIENKLISEDPVLTNIQKNLIREEDYKNIPATYKQDVKENIHNWIEEANNIVSGENPLNQTIPIALYNIVSKYLEDNYPELRKRDFAGNQSKLEEVTDKIVSSYTKSNALFKNNLEKKVKSYYNNPENDKTGDMLLGFTTVSNFDDEQRKRLQRLNEINKEQILPSMFSFQAGDLKGLTPEEVQEVYSDEDALNKYPEIVGIGGNEDTGILFSVKTPDNQVSIARLTTSPEYIYNIAQQLNRTDLLAKDIIAKSSDSFIPGKVIPIPNNDIKYYYDPIEGHSGYIETDGNKYFIEVEDIKALNQQLKKKGLPVLPIKEKASNNDIYYFKNKQDLLSVINLINSTK